jgi:hypothetical protein
MEVSVVLVSLDVEGLNRQGQSMQQGSVQPLLLAVQHSVQHGTSMSHGV